MFVRLESYQVGHWDPMTYGFAARVIKTIPRFLEATKFHEAFFQVLTPDNRICGSVGIFIRGDLDTPGIVDAPDSASSVETS